MKTRHAREIREGINMARMGIRLIPEGPDRLLERAYWRTFRRFHPEKRRSLPMVPGPKRVGGGSIPS